LISTVVGNIHINVDDLIRIFETNFDRLPDMHLLLLFAEMSSMNQLNLDHRSAESPNRSLVETVGKFR
jgi:hypothetical protein